MFAGHWNNGKYRDIQSGGEFFARYLLFGMMKEKSGENDWFLAQRLAPWSQMRHLPDNF